MQISLPRTQRNMANGNIFCFPTVPQRVETIIKMGAIVKLSRPLLRPPQLVPWQSKAQRVMAGAITKTIVDHFWHTHQERMRWAKEKESGDSWVELLVHLHNKTYLNIIIIRHRVAHATTQADAATAARAHCHQTTVRTFVDHEDLRCRRERERERETD